LWKKADLLVPRWLIRGVNERVDCFGAVVCPLSDEEVEDTVKELLKSGIESFAVCFLWSFLNPARERQAKRVIESVVPASFVTLSSDIAPALGEYERMVTTVINSYLGPGAGTDLASLEPVDCIRDTPCRSPSWRSSERKNFPRGKNNLW
jgi:N-methylhydantoinase A